MVKITAVVPVNNNENIIGDCLNSLLKQSRPFDEIIVVDDASKDNSVNIIKKFKGVKKIFLKKNIERSRSRNLGVSKAKNEYVAIMESDSVFNKDWCKHIVDSFEKGAVFICDKRLIYKPKTFIEKMENEIFELRLKKDYIPFVPWCFRKTAFLELKGFRHKMVGIEDKDFGTRAKNKGYSIIFQSKAIQYHAGEPKSFSDELKRSRSFGNAYKKYYKLYPKEKPLKLYFFLFFPFFPPFWVLIYLYLFFKYFNKLSLKFALVYPFISIFRNVVFSYSYFF